MNFVKLAFYQGDIYFKRKFSVKLRIYQGECHFKNICKSLGRAIENRILCLKPFIICIYLSFKLRPNSVREFILQFYNSKGNVVNCRIVLNGDFWLKELLNSHEPMYAEAMRQGFGTIQIYPSEDSCFEIVPSVQKVSVQNGKMYSVLLI